MYIVTKEDQIKELISRIPPILNIDLVIFKKDKDNIYAEPEFLVGKKIAHVNIKNKIERIFPGGRMHFDETPEDTINRILKKEIPGVEAKIKKMITAVSDKGYDNRCNGITMEYLLEYQSGEAEIGNDEFIEFKRMNRKEMESTDGMYFLQLSTLNEILAAIAGMNSTQDEILVQVDKDNHEIGSLLKREAHSNPSVYHRAAHIILFDSAKQVILQQRAPTKATHPNRRDMPGGHQTLGQSIDETAHAELFEEMGVNTELKLQRIGLYQNNSQSEYYYLYYGISDGPYAFDKYEVQKVMAFDCQKILNGEYDKKYAILPHVYKYIKELEFLRK
ncbi:MAG: NUDIX domain-containing protein [candidate division SR1 bacterium]|nr:NUDIX domain-containing protein [candidate division SR1 bacterium]